MKKVLIPLVVVVIALSIVAYAVAISGGQPQSGMVNAEKQLLADGDMEKSGVTDWTAGSGATLTKESGGAQDGKLVLRVADTDWAAAIQSDILTIGKTYRATGWLRTSGVGCTMRVGEVVSQTIYSGNWTYVETVGVATVAYMRIRLNSSGWCEADDIFVTEYAGQHTNAEKQILADGDMEKSGTSDWIEVDGVTATKELGAADDGSQVMRAFELAGSGGYVRSAGNPMTVGKTYRVTGWARGDGSARPGVTDGYGDFWEGTDSTEWQRVDGIKTVQSVNVYLRKSYHGDWTEFDNILVTEYAGEQTSNEQTRISLDAFTTSTGSWTVTTDGNGRKWIENVTAGFKYIESDQVYGTWMWDIYKETDAGQSVVQIMADTLTTAGGAGQDGYDLRLSITESIRLIRGIDGASTDIAATAASYIAIQTKYTLAITRASDGEFTFYIKGGAFTSWTQVDVSGGSGTNPVTDNTTTASTYFIADLDAGDKISNIQLYPNQVFTLTELKEHF